LNPRCVVLLDAFTSFAQSPTKLQEILGDEDDGALSSQLQAFAETVRNPDHQVTCQALKTWIHARVEDRLNKFDASRRSNHAEEMQKHAAFVCRHRRGVDLLCTFVARLALRPLLAAGRSKPTKEDVPLLFDQLTVSIAEGRSTIRTALSEDLLARAATKYVDRIIHLMLAEDTGLKATLQTWFPPLDAPPPGIALERVEMLMIAKNHFDRTVLIEQLSRDADLIDLRSRSARLFALVSKDYYALEISLLENKFKTQAPTIPEPSDPSINTIDLERLMLGKCRDFVQDFLQHAQQAYARASAFLGEEEDALEICLETLVSCASSRVVDEIVLPCCRVSARLCEDHNVATDQASLTVSATTKSSIQALRRSSSLRSFSSTSSQPGEGEKETLLSLHQRCKFLAEALTPFVESALGALESAHSFSDTGSAIQTLIQNKIGSAETALELLYAHQVHSAASSVLRKLQSFSAKQLEQDLDKVEEDTVLVQIVEMICECAEEISLLGEGALTNFALLSKDLIFGRIGALKKLSQAGGQVMAKELNRAAGSLEEAFKGGVSPECRGLINRVTAELRQTAHAFVLAKEDVLRGSVVMDLITKDLAQELVAKRDY
jgi:hypothetical protein